MDHWCKFEKKVEISSEKEEFSFVKASKSTSSFSGFSDPKPDPASPSASICSSSSLSHAASLPAVPPEVQIVEDELEPSRGLSGEGVTKVKGTDTSGIDSVLTLVWQSLGFSELVVAKALLSRVVGTLITTTLVLKPATHVYATPS